LAGGMEGLRDVSTSTDVLDTVASLLYSGFELSLAICLNRSILSTGSIVSLYLSIIDESSVPLGAVFSIFLGK